MCGATTSLCLASGQCFLSRTPTGCQVHGRPAFLAGEWSLLGPLGSWNRLGSRPRFKRKSALRHYCLLQKKYNMRKYRQQSAQIFSHRSSIELHRLARLSADRALHPQLLIARSLGLAHPYLVGMVPPQLQGTSVARWLSLPRFC